MEKKITGYEKVKGTERLRHLGYQLYQFKNKIFVKFSEGLVVVSLIRNQTGLWPLKISEAGEINKGNHDCLPSPIHRHTKVLIFVLRFICKSKGTYRYKRGIRCTEDQS